MGVWRRADAALGSRLVLFSAGRRWTLSGAAASRARVHGRAAISQPAQIGRDRRRARDTVDCGARQFGSSAGTPSSMTARPADGRHAGRAPACAEALSVAGIPAVNASAPEQCEQNDDRQRNAEQPEQCAFAKTHVSLLCFVGQKTPKPGRGSGRRRKCAAGFFRERKPRECVLSPSDLSGGCTPQADKRPRARAGVFFLGGRIAEAPNQDA